MICPKCNTENSETAKYCKGCGSYLVDWKLQLEVKAKAEAEARAKAETEVMAKAEAKTKTETVTAKVQGDVCKSCGASLRTGAKFCPKCGSPVEGAGSQTAVKQKVQNQTIQNKQEQEPRTINLQEKEPPAKQEPVRQEPVKQEPVRQEPVKRELAKQGKNGMMMTIVVILALLIVGLIVLLAVLFLRVRDNENAATVKAEQTGGQTTAEESDISEEEAAQLLAAVDELAQTGAKEIQDNEEYYSGIDHLKEAISGYREAAVQIGNMSLLDEKIQTAYSALEEGVIRHTEFVRDNQYWEQGAGGNYGQIVSELEDMLSIGYELDEESYNVSVENLQEKLDEIREYYPEKLIYEFNKFTDEKQTVAGTWSRTEAKNMMEDTYAGGMFSEENYLENPVYLRYAYAMAYWIQRENETELNEQKTTALGAAERIASQIGLVDYSPLLLKYYIVYMHEAGRDCSEAEEAYRDIVNHLKETQGLQLEEDIDLEHFWYFNDFSSSAEGIKDGEWNGVTPENRQWIRDRVSKVSDFAETQRPF